MASTTPARLDTTPGPARIAVDTEPIKVYAQETGDDVIAWWYPDCGLPEGLSAIGGARPASCGTGVTVGTDPTTGS